MGASETGLETLHRGAEADLFLSTDGPLKTVVKRRVRKDYRNKALDERIRRERTLAEVSILHDAKVAGVKVPSILRVEPDSNTFWMTFVEGMVARDGLDEMRPKVAKELFNHLGAMIGLLHSHGIVHGDLTTSNIVVTSSGEPFLVDFGMARRSSDPEDMGVDLHLLHRSVAASHNHDPADLFKTLSAGYAATAGKRAHKLSWAKAREIARRGRYFAIR